MPAGTLSSYRSPTQCKYSRTVDFGSEVFDRHVALLIPFWNTGSDLNSIEELINETLDSASRLSELKKAQIEISFMPFSTSTDIAYNKPHSVRTYLVGSKTAPISNRNRSNVSTTTDEAMIQGLFNEPFSIQPIAHTEYWDSLVANHQIAGNGDNVVRTRGLLKIKSPRLKRLQSDTFADSNNRPRAYIVIVYSYVDSMPTRYISILSDIKMVFAKKEIPASQLIKAHQP